MLVFRTSLAADRCSRWFCFMVLVPGRGSGVYLSLWLSVCMCAFPRTIASRVGLCTQQQHEKIESVAALLALVWFGWLVVLCFVRIFGWNFLLLSWELAVHGSGRGAGATTFTPLAAVAATPYTSRWNWFIWFYTASRR